MRIALISLLLTLAGCSSVAIDYQPGSSFQQYQTWAYSAPDKDAQSLDSQRIEKAVTTHIAGTGLEKAPQDQADLLIRGQTVDASRLESSGFSFGLGTRQDNVGFGIGTTPSVREIQEAKVVVEMVNRETSQVVWRGEGRRNLNPDMSPETRTKLINRLVEEMFEEYPPGNDY
jgi:hypothetical protein